MWDLLTSAAGGGLFGLVGVGAKMFVAYKDKQLVMAHEINMAKETRTNMEMEIELSKQKGSIELELQESDSDARNLTAAIEAEASMRGASPWVNDVRAMVRPVLTLVLVFAAMFAVSQSWSLDSEFVFMAMTAVTFWFGDRPRKTS